MNITRRKLLKALGIAPVIAAIPIKGTEPTNDGVMLNSIAHVKTEGASIVYDTNTARLNRKSLEDVYREAYERPKPIGKQLF